MKILRSKLASHFVAIMIGSACISLAQADILTGRVIKIADGDTLTVLDASKQQYRIRLTGIDAPEKKQALGRRIETASGDAGLWQDRSRGMVQA